VGTGRGSALSGCGSGAVGAAEVQDRLPIFSIGVSIGADHDGGATGVAAGDPSGGSAEADSVPLSQARGRRGGQGDTSFLRSEEDSSGRAAQAESGVGTGPVEVAVTAGDADDKLHGYAGVC
jgi:hypothetical protein